MQKNLTVSGPEALRRRDAWETFLILHVDIRFLKIASELLTRITGLAPTWTGGNPIWKGSELRSVIYHLAMLGAGMMLLLRSSGLSPKMAGAVLWIAFARGLTSGFGHHLTHSATGLPWAGKWTVLAYNVLGAIFWFPAYRDYRDEHGRHHAYVATENDPDRLFLQWVQARLHGWAPFLTTLFHPLVHARFLSARLRAVFAKGPAWRRALAAANLVILVVAGGGKVVAVWMLVVGLGYQVASITSWLSLHLWTARPKGMRTIDAALIVTFARLMLPAVPSAWGLVKLFFYGLSRALFLQSDLPQHVLHHLGLGPWTEAPYVLTRELLNGREIPITVSLRAMFEAPMASAAIPLSTPDSDVFLGM